MSSITGHDQKFRMVLCAVFFLSMIADVFASEPKSVSSSAEGGVLSIPSDWRVSSRLFVSIPSAKEWLLKKNSSGKWEITSRAQKSDDSVESFLVDTETKTIYLNVEPSRTTLHPVGSSSYRPDECSFGLLASATKPTAEVRSNERKVVGLTVCNSAFTKGESKNAVGTMIGVLSLAYGSRVTQMVVKTEDVRAAIGEAGLIRAAEDAQLDDYRNAYTNATTVNLLSAFIGRYSSNDPDGLLQRAIQKRDELLRVEREDRIKKDLDNQNARMVERTEQIARAQAQAARDADFQRRLKTEMETNCGLILEIKDSLAKVYFPVKNFGSEHWVNRASLFESGTRSCALVEKLK
jgi:hypothetical protein